MTPNPAEFIDDLYDRINEDWTAEEVRQLWKMTGRRYANRMVRRSFAETKHGRFSLLYDARERARRIVLKALS